MRMGDAEKEGWEIQRGRKEGRKQMKGKNERGKKLLDFKKRASPHQKRKAQEKLPDPGPCMSHTS